jgi:hypothetical protein
MRSEKLAELCEMLAGGVIYFDALTYCGTLKHLSRIWIVFRQRVPNEHQGFTLCQCSFNLTPYQLCSSPIFSDLIPTPVNLIPAKSLENCA